MKKNRDDILPPPWVFTVLFSALFVWLIYSMKEIFSLLLISYCLAFVIDPILTKLEEIKISRGVGIVLLALFALFVSFILISTAIPTLVNEYAILRDNFPNFVETAKFQIFELLKTFFPSLETKGLGDFQLLLEKGGVDASTVVQKILYTISSGFSFTIGLIGFFIVPIFVFYLAKDFRQIHHQLFMLVPLLHRQKVGHIMNEINFYISAFVRGQILVAIILFFLYSIGLAAVGVQLWFLLAFIAGFGNIIPYVGFMVGIILSTVMAIVTYSAFTPVFYVWGVFIVVQILEGNLITPNIMGNKVGLPPLIILLALLIGGHIGGLLGLFLAIPITAILRTLVGHLYNKVAANYQT